MSLGFVVLGNALVATALAALALVASRYVRRPDVVHGIWLVVLLSLLTPPLIGLAVLPPAVAPAAAASPLSTAGPAVVAFGPMSRALNPVASAEQPDRQRQRVFWSWTSLVSAGWLLVGLVILALAARRAAGFQRLLRSARAPDPSLAAAVRAVADRLGVAPPEVRLLPSPVAPMVWPAPLTLVFPSPLNARLGAEERTTLLAHELAHIKRRDHVVRWIELVATAAFWWHPVMWLARRELRRAEERCCDELVLRALPTHARAYAAGLLETAQLVASRSGRIPGLACGGEAKNLEERLTAIMKNRTSKPLPRPHVLALTITALALLFVYPTRAARTADEEQVGIEVASSAERVRDRGELLELRRRQLELERELAQLRVRERTLELELGGDRVRGETDRVLAQAVQLEVRGRLREAEELRREAEVMARQQAFEMRSVDLERELSDELESRAHRLRQLSIEIESLRHAGGGANESAAYHLEHEARELEAELRALEGRAHARQRDLRREVNDDQIRALQAEERRLLAAGELDSARRLKLERMLHEAHDNVGRENVGRKAELLALQGKLARVADEARGLGLADEAQEIEREVERLRAELRRIESSSDEP